MPIAKKKSTKRAAATSKNTDPKRSRRTLKDLDAGRARKVTGGRRIIPCI
jgi:hypothetical protein